MTRWWLGPDKVKDHYINHRGSNSAMHMSRQPHCHQWKFASWISVFNESIMLIRYILKRASTKGCYISYNNVHKKQTLFLPRQRYMNVLNDILFCILVITQGMPTRTSYALYIPRVHVAHKFCSLPIPLPQAWHRSATHLYNVKTVSQSPCTALTAGICLPFGLCKRAVNSLWKTVEIHTDYVSSEHLAI